MSDEKPRTDKSQLRRVTVVVRSWDGPNSRVGFEMDLNEMPWGPFDALGQKLDLLIPAYSEFQPGASGRESEIAKALRHVEHAADRCGEFAQASDGSRETWLKSQRTWEWVRRHLTHLWVQEEVEGDTAGLSQVEPEGVGSELAEPVSVSEGDLQSPTATGRAPAESIELPSMPGAAATLKAAVQALRTTPLSVWRETVVATDPEAPTREEAIQTLLGVAKILDGGNATDEIIIEVDMPAGNEPPAEAVEEEVSPAADPDFDQVTVDFAEGYDQGYQMGRKVGWALGARRAKKKKKGGTQR